MMTTRMPTTRRARRATRRALGRRGFTLVEMIVAVMFLTVGLLALAGASAVLARQMNGGSLQSLAAGTAEIRFERMRSLQCSQIAPGSATARGITEVWVKTDTLRAVIVTDTVKYTARKTVKSAGAVVKAYPYRTVIPCV
jgi:Tfp pilus assembly protein PilV